MKSRPPHAAVELSVRIARPPENACSPNRPSQQTRSLHSKHRVFQNQTFVFCRLSTFNQQPSTVVLFARLNLGMHTKSLLSSFLFRARTDLFLGRLRAPPDGFNNPADTRNRPGERFFCTRTGERRLPACKSRQLAETGFDGSLRVSHRMLPASCRQQQAGSLRSPE